MMGNWIPHIKKGFRENSLFRGWPAKSNLNACVGNNGGPYDLYDYAFGYFEATRLLLANSKSAGIVIDVVVYPICFNFRHAVELYIKYTIHDLAKLKKSKEKFEQKHTLRQNWATAKKLLVEIKPTSEDLTFFEEAINAIEQVDATGQTFRYPDTIKGDRHLKHWSLINLAVIEVYYEALFKIAREWHFKIDGALERFGPSPPT